MSFILDALKKAESERSRKAGPVLMDMRVAPPRQRLPAWAWILGCVLLANLLMLAWMLLRKPATEPAVAAPPSPAPIAQPAATAAPSPIAPVEPAPAPAPIVVAPVPATVPAPLPALALASAPAEPPPQIPAAAPAYPPSPRIDNLPTAQDLVAQGVSLPNLQMNLHVYDAVPANRYVLLNSRRMREGDEVADGVRVESITPGGVVLNARGRRFVLLAGG